MVFIVFKLSDIVTFMLRVLCDNMIYFIGDVWVFYESIMNRWIWGGPLVVSPVCTGSGCLAIFEGMSFCLSVFLSINFLENRALYEYEIWRVYCSQLMSRPTQGSSVGGEVFA